MPIEFGPSEIVTLAADASTPPALTQYAGIRLIWPQGLQLPPPGQPNVLRVQGVEVPGYLSQNGGGLTWVMTAATDPVVQALNAIPGPAGWSNEGSKALFANVGGALLGQGFTLAQVKTALTQLYQAAVADHVAANPLA